MSKLLSHSSDDLSFTTVYEFDGPPELVFDIMTNVEYLKQWMPDGEMIKTVETKGDFCVDGTMRFVMNGDESFSSIFQYKEIEKPNKIVYIDSYDRKDSTQNMPAIITATYEPIDGGKKTKRTIHTKYSRAEDLQSSLARRSPLDNENSFAAKMYKRANNIIIKNIQEIK